MMEGPPDPWLSLPSSQAHVSWNPSSTGDPGPGQAGGLGRALPFTSRWSWASPCHGVSSSVVGDRNTHLTVLLCGLETSGIKRLEHSGDAICHYYGHYYSFL